MLEGRKTTNVLLLVIAVCLVLMVLSDYATVRTAEANTRGSVEYKIVPEGHIPDSRGGVETFLNKLGADGWMYFEHECFDEDGEECGLLFYR